MERVEIESSQGYSDVSDPKETKRNEMIKKSTLGGLPGI
jgi:hypothetical protein